MESSERRSQLIAIAFDLFAKDGFRGTTTRLISETAEVSEATLFKYFPTKADLFTAILDDRICEVDPALIDWQAAREMEPRSFLRDLMTRILNEIYKDDKFSRFLMFSALESPDLWQIYVRKFIDRWHVVLVEYLRGQQARGCCRQDLDIELMVMAFYGPIALLNDMRNLFKMNVPPFEQIKRTVDQLSGIFLDGILHRGVTCA